jgi:hypothetical protein
MQPCLGHFTVLRGYNKTTTTTTTTKINCNVEV